MTQKVFRPHNYALLSQLSPQLEELVHISCTPLVWSRRTLEMRGSVLLLFRHPPFNPESADYLTLLSPTNFPSAQGSRAVIVGPQKKKIRFQSTAVRDAFLLAANDAILQSANRQGQYELLCDLGDYSSGTVYLVRRKTDGILFTMKVVSKIDAVSHNPVLAQLVAERTVLAEATSKQAAFIVRLADAFETATHFCFVTDLIRFGPLSDILKELPKKSLEEHIARQIFAEIVLATEECHSMGYLHRDISLTNCLVDKLGHIRLVGFGLAKKVDDRFVSNTLLMKGDQRDGDATPSEDGDDSRRLMGRTTSFVGTRRYMSPEKLMGRQNSQRGYGAPADVWAIGVSLYVMLTGDYPFGREVTPRNSRALFHAIQNEYILYPEWLSKEAVSILQGLLDRNPLQRLGIREIKAHPWMEHVNWRQVQLDSLNDVPQDAVLSVLQENKVESVEESFDSIMGMVDEVNPFSAAPKTSTRGSREWNREAPDKNELFGFGYCDLRR